VKEDFVIKTNRPTTLAYADVVNGIAEYTFVDEHSAGRLLDQKSLNPIYQKSKEGKGITGWRNQSSSGTLRVELAVVY
jgi:fructokinase